MPGHMDAHLQVAKTRLALRQLEAAQKTVQHALNLDSSSAPAHLLMAQVALSLNNHRAAEHALEEALASDFRVRTNAGCVEPRARARARRVSLVARSRPWGR